MPNRQAPAGYVIKLDGQPLRMMGQIGDVCPIGIVGEDFVVTVTKTPEAFSAEVEDRDAEDGTPQADVWLDGKINRRLPLGDHRLELPGKDVAIHVKAKTPPIPPIVVVPPTDIPTPPSGTKVVRLGNLTATLTPQSNTWYAPLPGQKTFTINAATGIRLTSGLANVAIFGAACIGKGNAGHGIDGTGTTGIHNVLFQGGSCRNYTNGGSIHGKVIEGPNVHSAVTFRDWRMLDTAGTAINSGQGWYLANIDGLTLEECFGHNIGTPPVNNETHWAYIAAGNHKVIVRRCFGAKVEHVFVQARGGEVRYGDPDSGDPGPLIESCIAYDAAVGFMPNGRRATLRNNVILQGHHSTGSNTLGGCAVWGAVGDLLSENNLLISSPVKGTGYTESWHNAPRSDAVWGYRGVCKTRGSGNVTKTEVVVDLSDLIARARSGEPIGPLVDEGIKRCRAAAGVN